MIKLTEEQLKALRDTKNDLDKAMCMLDNVWDTISDVQDLLEETAEDLGESMASAAESSIEAPDAEEPKPVHTLRSETVRVSNKGDGKDSVLSVRATDAGYVVVSFADDPSKDPDKLVLTRAEMQELRQLLSRADRALADAGDVPFAWE